MIYRTVDKQADEIKDEDHLNSLIYRDYMLLCRCGRSLAKQIRTNKSIEKSAFVSNWESKDLVVRV